MFFPFLCYTEGVLRGGETMNSYVTGALIRALRERDHLTQADLAEKLHVSEQAVSRWENGKGYPDITLLPSLSEALNISVTELLCGEDRVNRNPAANILKSVLYVCPVCGNILFGMGSACVTCHGITLPPLSAESPDSEHTPAVSRAEDELYLSFSHEMTRDHHISFLAAYTPRGFSLVKLYPEEAAEARFSLRGLERIYWYCNRHGLYSMNIKRGQY